MSKNENIKKNTNKYLNIKNVEGLSTMRGGWIIRVICCVITVTQHPPHPIPPSPSPPESNIISQYPTNSMQHISVLFEQHVIVHTHILKMIYISLNNMGWCLKKFATGQNNHLSSFLDVWIFSQDLNYISSLRQGE